MREIERLKKQEGEDSESHKAAELSQQVMQV